MERSTQCSLTWPLLGKEKPGLVEEIHHGELDKGQARQSYYRPQKCEKEKVAARGQGVLLALRCKAVESTEFLASDNGHVITFEKQWNAQPEVDRMIAFPGHGARSLPVRDAGLAKVI